MLEWLVVKIDELLAISVRIAAALEGLADETRQQRLLFAETDLSVKRVVAAVRGLVDRRQGQEPRIRPGLGANAEVDALIDDRISGGEGGSELLAGVEDPRRGNLAGHVARALSAERPPGLAFRSTLAHNNTDSTNEAAPVQLVRHPL